MALELTNCCGSEVRPTVPAGPQLKGCCEPTEPGMEADPEVSKRIWIRLGIALVIAGQGMMLSLGLNTLDTPLDPGRTAYWWLHGILIASSLAVIGLLGKPLFVETWNSWVRRRITVEALFLLSFMGALGGSLVATFTGVGDVYYEVVAIVMCVYTVGKSITRMSRKRALAAAEKLREDFQQVTILTCCGHLRKIDLSEVQADTQVIVAPGEPVAVDGIIVSGRGFVLETAMTGEPLPVVKHAGDRLLAGTYSVDGRFEVRPEHWRGDRRLDEVLHTVESARLQPSTLQVHADRIVQWFVPLVTGISLLTFAVWIIVGTWAEALFNSMAVLLVACPCALGLATPIAVWSGLHRLAKLGMVARSGHFLDALAKADFVVFDKTGTLSEEDLVVAELSLPFADEERRRELLQAVLAVEMEHSHPVARALCGFARQQLGTTNAQVTVQSMQILPGLGVRAQLQNARGHTQVLAIGSEALVADGDPFVSQLPPAAGSGKRRIFVVLDEQLVGVFQLKEKLRAGTREVFAAVRSLGLKGAILTGDPEPEWTSVDGVEVEFGLSPQAKTERVRALQAAGSEVIFLGDGINDSGAMSACAGSIAMAGGSALTKSTAACVLLGNTLESLPKAIEIARNIFGAIRGNMIFALTYNIVGMALAACGVLHPIVAALLMVGSSIIVSLRASRSALV